MLLYGRYELSPGEQHGNKILGFKENESLIFIKAYHKDENWLRVGNIKGNVGYIPKNYVGIANLPNTDHLLEFVTNATLSAKMEKMPTYQELKELSEKMEKQEFRESQTNLLLQVLAQKDIIDEISEAAESEYTCTSTPEEDETTTCVNTSAAVTPRSERFSSTSIASLTSTEPKNIQITKSKIPKSLIPLPTQQSSKSKIGISIKEAKEGSESWQEIATNLTKIVKEAVAAEDLDLSQSKVIVQRILAHLNEFANSGMEEKIENLLQVFEKHSKTISNDEASEEKLARIMKYLISLEPQNLHTLGYLEDESNVLFNLEQLTRELLNINAMTFERLIKASHYRWIHDLSKLYQDETRENIRNKLLEVFSMIATIDPKSGSIMLAQEMRSEKEQNNLKKLSRIANTLISILTTTGDDAFPKSHLLEFGTEFFEFILNHLENDLCDDLNWKQDAVNLLLAINLQFSPEDNLLIKTLAGRKRGRYLIESLLNLVDSQIDPIKGGHPQQTATNNSTSSTMKLVKDMFSSRITAEHFLTGDLQWLTDFIYNKISELRSGDRRRTAYLELLNIILKNRGFHHRMGDLKEVFTPILLEDDPLSFSDQTIIKGIAKEFHIM